MPVITLPDGSQRVLRSRRSPWPKSPRASAPGLAQAALAGRVDGKLVDTSLSHRRSDAQLAIVTDKDPDGLEVIRHSTAHLLAQAVQAAVPRRPGHHRPGDRGRLLLRLRLFERPFTPEDLAAIEARMTELAKADLPVTRREHAARRGGEASSGSMGEHYKAEIIASIPAERADQPLRPGRLGRPVPRPARAVHRQAQGLQADEGGRRLLARRFAQRDAAAHLRHGLARREAARRTTCTGSRKPRSATTAASAASWTCSTCRKRRRARCSGIPKGWTLFQHLIGYMRERSRTRRATRK